MWIASCNHRHNCEHFQLESLFQTRHNFCPGMKTSVSYENKQFQESNSKNRVRWTKTRMYASIYVLSFQLLPLPQLVIQCRTTRSCESFLRLLFHTEFEQLGRKCFLSEVPSHIKFAHLLLPHMGKRWRKTQNTNYVRYHSVKTCPTTSSMRAGYVPVRTWMMLRSKPYPKFHGFALHVM